MIDVNVHIDGLRLESLNKGYFGASRRAVFARAAKVRKIVDSVYSHVLEHVAAGELAAIELTRISAGTLDDDNLVGSAKPALDGIARAWEVNDKTFVLFGDRPGVRVSLGQRLAKRGTFGVELVLRLEERDL